MVTNAGIWLARVRTIKRADEVVFWQIAERLIKVLREISFVGHFTSDFKNQLSVSAKYPLLLLETTRPDADALQSARWAWMLFELKFQQLWRISTVLAFCSQY